MVERVLDLAKEARASKESGRATLGTPTGLADLDRTLNGLNPGLYVMGGSPGVGKTSLALQWAMKAAEEVPVVYVTYENSPSNLTLKAIGRLANISPSDVDRGQADLAKLQEGAADFGKIAHRLAFVEGTASTTTSSIQGQARQAMARHGARRCLVIVDYLQRMAHASGYGTLRENVSALTLGLRKLATQLDSPVLAISSLSRGVNNYAHPTLEALKESGDLEFTADVVLLLGKREDALGRGPRKMVDLEVAKNRFGEAGGKVGLSFDQALGGFAQEART
jgi:replicative DNA helicase